MMYMMYMMYDDICVSMCECGYAFWSVARYKSTPYRHLSCGVSSLVFKVFGGPGLPSAQCQRTLRLSLI